MFELGKVYRRRDLHHRFGGQQQGGVVTPAGHLLIFLITGEAGLGYGYHDEAHDDGSFLYYGEGQSGPMTFIRGNRAIRDHTLTGRDLHLFEKATRMGHPGLSLAKKQTSIFVTAESRRIGPLNQIYS